MASDEIRFVIISSAFGPTAVVGGRDGIRAVLLPGSGSARVLRSEVKGRFPGAVEDDRGLKAAGKAILRYFETGRLPRKTPRLDLGDVDGLRKDVYEALVTIPAGETITYAELARRIGRPGAHRSVGTALSRNPIPLLIPCHRVLRTDGGLGGFTAAGGVDLKRKMLELEGALS